MENHPSIYSSVTFHLKKATGNDHIRFLLYTSCGAVLKNPWFSIVMEGYS